MDDNLAKIILALAISVASWGIKSLYGDFKKQFNDSVNELSKEIKANTKAQNEISSKIQALFMKQQSDEKEISKLHDHVNEVHEELTFMNERMHAVINAEQEVRYHAAKAGWPIKESADYPIRTFLKKV